MNLEILGNAMTKDCVRVCTYCHHDINVHIDTFNEQEEKVSQRCMAGDAYHIGVPPVKKIEDSRCECTEFEWDRTFVWVPPE